jgi:phospholipid/cholesterol/gamma-HCH transport system ATP-binding protein
MRLAKKLADRVVFLHEAKALFFGTYAEMERCEESIVQEFLKLDEPGIKASIGVNGWSGNGPADEDCPMS